MRTAVAACAVLAGLTASQELVLEQAVTRHARVLRPEHFTPRVTQLLANMDGASLDSALHHLCDMPPRKMANVRNMPAYLFAFFSKISDW